VAIFRTQHVRKLMK